MKKNNIFKILSIAFIFTLSLLYSNLYGQEASKECKQATSIFYENYKERKFEDAYPHWLKSFTECPQYHIGIFAYGPKIIEAKLKNTKDSTERQILINKIFDVLQKRAQYFPKKTKIYDMIAEKADIMLKYKQGTLMEAFNLLDTVYNQAGIKMSAPDLFNYFKTAIKLRKEEGFGGDEKVFEIYDNALIIIEKNIENLSATINELSEKENASRKEKSSLKRSDIKLKNFKAFEEGINKMIAPLATCERLDAIFSNGFLKEENKTDEKWLAKSVTMLGRKKCYDLPIYLKLAEAYYQVNPSAPSARAIARLALTKEKNMEKAVKYFEEAANIETDPNTKAKDLALLATAKLGMGKKIEARKIANQAAGLKKFWGEPYIIIGKAYAESINDCGKNEFEKKAVYWAAIEKFRYAARIDKGTTKEVRKLLNIYEKLAPTKSMIFQYSNGASKFKIACWINEEVSIPKL